MTVWRYSMVGIYMLKNIVNNKVYVGQSINISARKYRHIKSLRKGTHRNKHLQSAWDKYGESSFEFIILECCNECDLDTREQYWIDFYGGIGSDQNYNQREAGKSGSLSIESKLKISNSLKGNIPWNKGLTAETDDRIKQYSDKLKGHILSETTKIKISDAVKDLHQQGKYKNPKTYEKRKQTQELNGTIRKDKGTKRGNYSLSHKKSISEGKKKAFELKRQLGQPLRSDSNRYKETKEFRKITNCVVCGKPFEQLMCKNVQTCCKVCKNKLLSMRYTERTNKNGN